MIFGVNANGTPVKFKRTRYNPIMGDRREYSRIARLARLKNLKWIQSNPLKVGVLQSAIDLTVITPDIMFKHLPDGNYNGRTRGKACDYHVFAYYAYIGVANGCGIAITDDSTQS